MARKLKQTLVRAAARGQKGFGLVETLVAVAILGTSVAAFISGLSAGSIAVRGQDVTAVSQGLAQTQMEYTKSYAYNPSAVTYPAVTAPTGYSISVSVSAVPSADTNIQKITVTVSRTGETPVTVAGYKVNR
jgi:prepilin-type N-terminal cleavage/methylation domain-containing protein